VLVGGRCVEEVRLGDGVVLTLVEGLGEDTGCEELGRGADTGLDVLGFGGCDGRGGDAPLTVGVST
tara:strand:- start:6015 stop:6212 length:198 start_codon:yes stop_codon:yes gene_type:complete